MLSFLKRFAPDSANENLKIFTKIFAAGSNLLDTIPNEPPYILINVIENAINQRITNMNLKPKQVEEFKTKQLTKAYQIIQKKPELIYDEFTQKLAEQI